MAYFGNRSNAQENVSIAAIPWGLRSFIGTDFIKAYLFILSAPSVCARTC